MKVRNGFVSNSSSSSFVVVFPKKPKTVKDVLNFMFDGKEGGVGIECYSEGLSYNQVSTIVFDDIKEKKNATKAEIIDLFSSRYHYNPQGNCFSRNSERDEKGGNWSERRGRYYGSDKETMNLYRDFVIASEEQEKVLREEELVILKAHGYDKYMGAYAGGKDPYTKKPYTKKQIKEANKYHDNKKDFTETNKEYIKYRTKSEKFREKWDTDRKLRELLAEKDAENFINDNKDKFIFIVSYGDESGTQGGIMEHANVFRNVPHIVINQH